MAVAAARIGIAVWKNVDLEKELRDGDLVEFPRNLLYSHWGVYVGDGDIVHLSGYGDEKRGVSGVGYQEMMLSFLYGMVTTKGRVCKEKFIKVASDSVAKINNSRDEEWQSLTPAEIVRRALSRIGDEEDYDVMEKNCEHFATWCRYGVGESKQIDNAKAGAAAAVEIGKAGATAAVEIGKAGAAFALEGLAFLGDRFLNAMDEAEKNRKQKNEFNHL